MSTCVLMINCSFVNIDCFVYNQVSLCVDSHRVACTHTNFGAGEEKTKSNSKEEMSQCLYSSAQYKVKYTKKHKKCTKGLSTENLHCRSTMKLKHPRPPIRIPQLLYCTVKFNKCTAHMVYSVSCGSFFYFFFTFTCLCGASDSLTQQLAHAATISIRKSISASCLRF